MGFNSITQKTASIGNNKSNIDISQVPRATEPKKNLEIVSNDDFKESKRRYSSIDKDDNGINDVLDKKLSLLSANNNSLSSKDNIQIVQKQTEKFDEINEFQSLNSEGLESLNLTVIVQFHEDFRKRITNSFKSYGGKILKNYRTAIKGILGKISPKNLIELKGYLNSREIPFFIEEDTKVKGDLYYTGRNMNLRPYVWDKLGYDGDEWSSIAVIDTGIDPTHNFHYGYRDGDFNYKIVGWKDFVDNTTSPRDDNHHGTHVAGIAAGEGTNPKTSEPNEYYVTKNFVFNGTGLVYTNGTASIHLANFEIINDSRDINLIYEFDDFTGETAESGDDINATAFMTYNDSIVHQYTSNTNDDWLYNPEGDEVDTNGSIGSYNLWLNLSFIDKTGDGKVYEPDIAFRSIIHYPFNPNNYSTGNIWRGVANDTHLVGIKALNYKGSGYTSDIIDSIQWAIDHKLDYNITVLSMSLSSGRRSSSIENAVDYAVEEGIVTVVAAGNDGPEGIHITSPGFAPNVITVGAINSQDNITYYSSEGGKHPEKLYIKPDIVAPGGSLNDRLIFSGDTNDNDAQGIYGEAFNHDLTPLQGTSMATPAVSGAVSLLIEAMGGYKNWNYNSSQQKLVKSLLLMTATETYPLLRESSNRSLSPKLNRGGKDVHEGYGRINIDMAIEAYTKRLKIGTSVSKTIVSSVVNSFDHHGIARNVHLFENKAYKFILESPTNADFDLFLYEGDPTDIGEPIISESSISPVKGDDEIIHFSPESTGRYYLVAKAVSGQGVANITSSVIEDLSVSLTIPQNPEINKPQKVIAEVEYLGDNILHGISLNLTQNGEQVTYGTFYGFESGETNEVEFQWIPTEPRSINFTAFTDTLDNESNTQNNEISKTTFSRIYYFYEDFEDDLSKWNTVEKQWHVTSDSSGLPNSSHSSSHSIWFGDENFGYYRPEDPDFWGMLISIPINLSKAGKELYLEFYHWRETETFIDDSYVDTLYDRISERFYERDTLQIYSINIDPWRREVINISSMAGKDDVELRFRFLASSSNDEQYRGWLIDDIKIYGNLDDIAPEWKEIPVNQTIASGETLNYNLNATDPSGIDRYWVNDTDNFQINEEGVLSNPESLEEGVYWLELRSYDTYNNYLSSIIKVTVESPIQFIPGYEPILILSILGITTIIIVLVKRNAIEE
jgi:subtilisin family serine protease